ncbi:MAG: hydroxyacylglutathione hydrolase [Rhodobacterales bacterium]|nr:hydroxyacylglutathione hydrolase [Rhodobacterales bacterium]
MPLDLVTIPCRSDNYAYLMHDAASGTTICVDVPDAAPILDALAARDWALGQIWITHHHGDHVEGVEALRAATGAHVVGAAADAHRLPPLDQAVAPGDRLAIGDQTALVLDASGHTLGHLAYHLPGAGLVFTADSLMAGGCGRLFEGTPARMWDTLTRLAALPPDTLVCSGHEYTQSNLRFALSVDPDNPALRARADRAAAARARGEPTVPVPLAEELATNPVLRADAAPLRAAMGLPDAPAAQVFAALRAAKDRF